MSHEQSWDGSNYNVQDSAGSRGVIAFAGKQLVAAFFSADSQRQAGLPTSFVDADHYLKGLPAELQSLAYDEALQYLLQNVSGEVKPVITAAFWGDGRAESVQAAEPWQSIFDNGALLVRNQLLEAEPSILAWKEEFELSENDIELIHRLFERRLSDSDSPVQLTSAETRYLEDFSSGEDGIEACRESFAEIGIIF